MDGGDGLESKVIFFREHWAGTYQDGQEVPTLEMFLSFDRKEQKNFSFYIVYKSTYIS